MAKEKEENEHKYKVADLAAKLGKGLTDQSTRVFLRSIEAERDGRAYGWDTAAELEALVKQYNSRKKDSDEPTPTKTKAKIKRKEKEAA